ncbi:cysteine--tRNA ligase [Candidatus Pacearchaeota archaeon]|jgi:cysteinyl-tRNA synthetase|nr:cysteine--tRNA ligase [Candidatus Pacearchaeota archaeon]
MKLKLYNTLTRKKEEFKPIKKDSVRMYVCGPTVNDVPHLGHARQQITFDILRKYLKFLGMSVKFVSNITDIDDKIIKKANELGEDIKKLTERNLKAHIEDYGKIGVDKPDVQTRATEYVSEMINLIERLEKKGYTYVINSDGVYYNISKFKDYGKLSHQKIEDLISGKRVDVNEEKKNKEDFVLWKFSKPGEPSWNSPWGKGRPGWHIECSAMSEKILGLPFDIHGGGQDLIFPHHEDEIAQSEAATGKKFVNYWVHNGMVNVDNVKMSKSLGNFKTIRDLLKDYDGRVIRYFIISSHYRKPVDFSKQTLDDAKKSYERLKNIISELKDDKKINSEYLNAFKDSMNDDLNTPEALAVLWKLIRDKDAKGKIGTIKEIEKTFELDLLKNEKVEIPDDVLKIVEEREEARKNKDWKKSDALREKIKKKGWQVDDIKEGYKIKKLEWM